MSKKEKYSLIGVDGNAFCVMGYVAKAMKREHKTQEEINCLCNGIFHDIDEEEVFKQARFNYEKKNDSLKNWILVNKNIVEIKIN